MTNLQLVSTEQKEYTPMKLIKSDLKVFNTRYLKSLNLITIKGWSITEDAWIKYCQILADVEGHLLHRQELNIYFKLELFNSTSTKYLFKLIKRLNKAHLEGKKVKIFWSVNTTNEAEIIDAGLDLAGMCHFPFKISEL